MPIDLYISHYWGKAQPRSSDGPRWHPLAYHGLDVAAAGEALLNARPGLVVALADTSSLDVSTVRRWLLFALALHDIGKFTDCFQAKVPELWRNKVAWPASGPAADPGHGWSGGRLWASDCQSNVSASNGFTDLFGPRTRATLAVRRAFDRWMTAVAGHHGRPVPSNERWIAAEHICAPALEGAECFVKACARLFQIEQHVELPEDWEQRAPIASWLIAGLAMVSDWIGSNQEWFEYEKPDHTVEQYWAIARKLGAEAIAKSGLAGAGPAGSYGLADALGKPPVAPADGGAAPRSIVATPLQQWAETVEIRGPSIVVIEDLTGAGKTEAAVVAAHRLMRAGAGDGLYWALPTMATADALYGRLAGSYGRLFADATRASLVLAHSSRDFNDVFQKSIAFGERAEARYGPGGSGSEDPDETTATAACTRWLADDRRKTFLADVGVGTIDQALLSILPSKHQALRLAGLCRRVLVIDEVHSLDAYQGALVETLLRFHAALGGSAILVSATLTRQARQKLVAAFAQGAGWRKPALDEPSFPSASIVDARGLRQNPTPKSRGTLRDLPVQRISDAAGALGVLLAAAREGRAAVWVRNTVQDAIEAFTEARVALPNASVQLFHARFALGDRLRIQDGVLNRFGKSAAVEQRNTILIATQVVEQSLDCDWDVMISDLAPIDLLIQRAGRLHRHERGPRPAPVLYVVGPEPAADAGANWYEAAFPRAAFVYLHHAQLWATMQRLLDGGLPLASANPRDILEQIYEGDEATWPPALVEAAGQAIGAMLSARATAHLNGLDLRKGFVHQAGAWETDTRTPTRLGDPTRVLRLFRWDGHMLEPWWREAGVERRDPGAERRRALRLSEVTVLARRVSDVIVENGALKRAMAAEIATWPDRFDPPLLVPLIEVGGGEWRAMSIDQRDGSIEIRYSPVVGMRYAVPAASPRSPPTRG